jgi:hypothetical protein
MDLGLVCRRHQHTDAPHAFGLLGTRGERPGGCRTAKQRDELPPP